MAYSMVSICNGALARMGQTRYIKDLNEATTEAKLCNTFYLQCLDDLLSDYPWRWATQPVTLALKTDEPVDKEKWKYAYAYPSDCVCVQSVLQSSLTAYEGRIPDEVLYTYRAPFAIRRTAGDTTILTNEQNAVALCTLRITDPLQYPPAFANALQWRLAVELALPLTGGKTTLRDNLMNYYLSAKDDAERKDANEATNVLTPIPIDYLDVRR